MYCARNPSPIRRVVLCSAMQPHPAPHPAAPDDTIGPRMEPALSAPYPPPPVCLIGLLKENSRPGFGVRGSTLHQGPQPFKYLNGVGDSTSVVWNPWPESLKAQQQPSASLHTSIKGGYTEFDWTDSSGKHHEDRITSLVRVDHRSKPGAAGPIHSTVVGQIKGLKGPAYGPYGAQINTGDSRGRWIHGGGSSLGIHAYDPDQRLTPTFGCTRAHNADVERMGGEITNFQTANPRVPIPYTRTDQ